MISSALLIVSSMLAGSLLAAVAVLIDVRRMFRRRIKSQILRQLSIQSIMSGEQIADLQAPFPEGLVASALGELVLAGDVEVVQRGAEWTDAEFRLAIWSRAE